MSGVATMTAQLQGPGATADGNGTVATTDGWNGAQEVRIKNTGSGTCSVTLEGSFEQNTWYGIEYEQVDGVWPSIGGASAISVTAGNITPFAHVYKIDILYPNVRARISGTAGSIIVDVLLYAASQ